MTTEACKSCGSYDADVTRADGLCEACGHVVDYHGAFTWDAYAVECDGTCGCPVE